MLPRAAIRGISLGLVIATLGCGKSEEDRVRDTVTSFYNAMHDRDGDEACALLSEHSRSLFDGQARLRRQAYGLSPAGATCVDFVKERDDTDAIHRDLGSNEREYPYPVKIQRVTINGPTATVDLAGKLGVVSPDLRKVDGSWEIVDF